MECKRFFMSSKIACLHGDCVINICCPEYMMEGLNIFVLRMQTSSKVRFS